MISVLIVTYNSSLTIQRCLESLERQTTRAFRVILADNDSQDITREILI